MKDLIVFIINPVLYILYKLLNYKKFLDSKKEILFALSLAIINTYIPYNAGDSVRYAFKYYELALFPIKEAWNNYLPHQDYLYYGVLFVFSRLKIPYHLFVTFISFIIFFIILSLIRNNMKKLNTGVSYFLLLYNPISIALGLRFILAGYIMVYSTQINNRLKKIILIISAILIHQTTVVIIIIYIFNEILNKFFKVINIKLIAFIMIFVGNLIYINIDNLYKHFPNVYIIKKTFNYINRDFFSILWLKLNSKLGFMIIFIFLAFIFSYMYLFTLKNIKQKEYNFLIIFGAILISFIRIYDIPSRFFPIFNIFFIIFLLRNKKKENLFLFCYKSFSLCYIIINILIMMYYSSYFYMKNYKVIPQFILPTPIQIIGINNKYNKKIKLIAEEYPEKKLLGRSLMAELKQYY